MASFAPGTPGWLEQVSEEVFEPDRRIIDPHHHLWHRPKTFNYLLGDLWTDTGSGHRIEKTVFVEANTNYRNYGPEDFKCVGETEFVTGVAKESAKGGAGKSVISGIVSHVDLTLGDAVEEVLLEHKAAGEGFFRGIRHIAARDTAIDIPAHWAEENLYALEKYRAGSRVLGKLGMTQDVFHLHRQNRDFLEMVRAIPETTFILNHFGAPLGIGPYADRREEVFTAWCDDIAQIAACPNVVAKLGGLAMPINGFGWNERETPATSDEIVEAQKRYYLHTIESFGPDRCMFESNFPVEKASVSYRVIWNAFKKMASDFSEDEKEALFYSTAKRVYQL